jgi:hypothetical protein
MSPEVHVKYSWSPRKPKTETKPGQRWVKVMDPEGRYISGWELVQDIPHDSAGTRLEKIDPDYDGE